MVSGPLLAVGPLVALVVTGGVRRAAALLAALGLVWLNLSWLLPLLDETRPLPAALEVSRSTPALVVGHLAVVFLVLVVVGVFSPRRGSPADLALRAARRGDHVAAGEYWAQAGSPRRAYRAFVRGHAWLRAADAARNQWQLRHAADLLQREGGHSLGAAAQLYLRIDEEALAEHLWGRYGQYLVDTRQPEAAIDAFLKSGDAKRAAHAAELAMQSRRLGTTSIDLALRAAREAKRPQLAATIALSAQRFREAGEQFLAAGAPIEAARAFERAGETMRAAEALRAAGHTDTAARMRARRLADSGQLHSALAEYERAGMLGEAAATLVQLGKHEQAFEYYRKAGMSREAAELARDHLEPREAAKLFEEVSEWGEAGACWDRAGDLKAAGRCYEKSGNVEGALAIYARGGMLREQAELLVQLGRLEDAFLVLFQAGDMRGAWELLSSRDAAVPALAEPLVKLSEWLRSQGDTTGAITAVQRATAGRTPSRELLPAFYALAQLLEEHGDLRAAATTLQKVVEYDYGFRDAAQRLQAISGMLAAEDSSGAVRMAAADTPTPDPTGRYTIAEEIGRGGMGVVYRAHDTRLGRTVAIKVLHARQHTPEAIRRFEREARAAAALSHPGIVHIYDFDRGFGSYFIAMEYVSGPTLIALLRSDPTFVRWNLKALMRQIVDAVAYAHAAHVVHRDLKPANMILADRKQIKILDFGIARRIDDHEATASGATGTPYYMAPEQILGEQPDERTDVYALGVTFFLMATGKLPFASGNVLRAHLEQQPPDPKTLVPDLDEALRRLILRCLAKNPDDRYRNGAALLAAVATRSEELLR